MEAFCVVKSINSQVKYIQHSFSDETGLNEITYVKRLVQGRVTYTHPFPLGFKKPARLISPPPPSGLFNATTYKPGCLAQIPQIQQNAECGVFPESLP